jgi:hypothetical protein
LQVVSGQIEVGKALVRCFAECCIPPHVVNHPSFRDLIKTVQANPRAGLPDQAYCEIAAGNKRQRELPNRSKGSTLVDAFRSRMRAAVRARKEREAAAQAVGEARAAAAAADSDDDTAPPNGFDEILEEVCEEAGYDSEESDGEAW